MYLPDPESFRRHDAVPVDRHLTALEQRVVAMARTDADNGMIEPRVSGLARFLGMMTGVEGPQPLADARLETLRRYAGFTRTGDRRAGGVEAELIRLGYSPDAVMDAAVMACA